MSHSFYRRQGGTRPQASWHNARKHSAPQGASNTSKVASDFAGQVQMRCNDSVVVLPPPSLE